jgi:hypothetical protein
MDTEITDAELEHLKELVSLRFLYICRTPQVTDVGLKHLEGLNSLEALFLAGTPVTDEGIKKLQEALPTCQIWH